MWHIVAGCLVAGLAVAAWRAPADTDPPATPPGLPGWPAAVAEQTGRGSVAAVSPEPSAAASTAGGGLVDGNPLTTRTVDGAVASVMVFLELGEEVVLMSPEQAAETQRRYATAATAESVSAELAAQVEQLRAAAGPGLALDVAPISWMVTEVRPGEEYNVSVWYVEVFSLGGPTDAYGTFRTYSAAVEWEDGSWKLGDTAVFDGPQPIVSSGDVTPGPELRAQLTGFDDGGPLAPLLGARSVGGDR